MLLHPVRLGRKIIGFLRREQIARELAEEIATHRSLLKQGAPDRETHVQGHLDSRMGNVTLAREESRDVWTFGFLDAIFRDLRQSLRGLVRNPAFAATAIISLALGIGANTAIFTGVLAIFRKPLAVRDPSALVTLSVLDGRGRQRESLPFTFARQLGASPVFSDVIAVESDGLSFQYGERAERIMGEVVTPNFFPALGIKTILGEGFSRDVRNGKWLAEVVLSYSFWKARFAGDPNILGRVIKLNTYRFTIVGVSPSSFYDVYQGQDPELRLPLLPLGRQLRELNLLNPEQDFNFMARLAPGIGRLAAQTAANIQLQEFMRSNADNQVRRTAFRNLQLHPGDRGWVGLSANFRTPLLVLFLLVVVVLLLACANVANMSLARAEARRREIVVRTSLGAGRARLMQQMMIESLLLACVAGASGLFMARYVAQSLSHFLPQGHIHYVLDIPLTVDSVVFAVVLSVLAALVFGSIAALQGTQGDLVSNLKSDSSGSVGGTEAIGLKKALLVGQVAFALALLVVAGLFIRTVLNLNPKADFADANRILVFTMKPQEEIYSPERIRSLMSELIRRVTALPGIQAVSLAENGPFASRQDHDDLQTPGSSPIEATGDSVMPGFFDTLHLPILAGRDFTPNDRPGSPKVIVINESLAKALFPRQNPLDRIVEMPSSRGSQFFQVIGVVKNSHYYDPRRIRPGAFYAFQNDPPYMPTLHVRVASPNPAAYIPAVFREFDVVDKGFPVFNVRTLEDRIDDALARERLIADLSTVFGALALALAAVGLYGVFTYSVTRRTREIGLRMALGSKASAVLWLVIRDALLLVGMGTGIGSALATGGAYLVSSELYAITPADPLTIFASAMWMLLVSSLAVFLPARRASRIDPMIALRHD